MSAMGREAAQRLAGHSSPKTTALYVARTNEMLTRAAAALEEAL